MKGKRVTLPELKKIIKNLDNRPIKNKSHLQTGTFAFKGFRIQISQFGKTTAQRVSTLYHKRRDNGVCIQCSKKVTKINKKTGNLYRMCDFHRKKIDWKRR